MNTRTFLALFALVAAAGCGSKPSPSAGAPPAGGPSPSAGGPGGNPLSELKVEVPTIPVKNTEGWKAPSESTLTAVDIGAKMDAALRSLRNVACVATLVGETPKGRVSATLTTSIRDDKTFEVSFARLSNGVPTTGIARADGKRVKVLEDAGYTKARAVGAGKKRDAEALVQDWAHTFPTHVFDGLVDGGEMFKTLIDGWSRGMHGYRITLEERITPYEERQIKNYRILAERPVVPGKVETAEIVVDGTLFLPVTLRSKAWDDRGHATSFQWSADWKNNQKLDPKKFVVGK